MPALDHPVFDADNHYYEALDAFTRHVDPKLRSRAVQWVDIDGRQHHLVGGKLSYAVANPTFNPIAKPGALHDYFRGNPDGKSPAELLRDHEPIPDHYHHPEARLEVMDRQGIDWIWLFPTLGVLYEELLKDDPEAVSFTFHAFNRWLEEDWGFAYQDRIFAAPYISLAQPEAAVRELEWVLERGARIFCIRPAAVWTETGPKPPGDPVFDPFWARVNEAGITAVIHAGDSGYSSQGYARDGFGASFKGGGGSMRPSIKAWAIERAALDFLATVVFDRIFERFPNVRVASVENGSEFLSDLLRKLASTSKKVRGYFDEDPVATFKRHVWINPFWEDDVNEVAEHMGPERVIFGSDWPHIEGMPQPLDYLEELSAFDAKQKRKILLDNALELTGLSG